MLNKTKLLTCLFASTFLLAACGNTEGSTEEEAAENDTELIDDTDEVVEETPEEEELPDYDFGGLTLKVGAPYSREIDPNANERSELLAERIAFLEEEWNFTYETVELGWDDYIGQYVRSTLAGDPVADIVYMLSPQLFPNLVSNGIVYPVSDLGVIDYDDTRWSDIAKDASEYQGKYYSVTPNGADNNRGGIFWNKTLFDEQGLPNLYELYENGEWTWEKMIEIAEEATMDTNNDGETDIYGLASGEFAWNLIYSNGYESITKTDSGIEIDMMDDKVIESLEFYQTARTNSGHVFRDWREGDEWNFGFTEFGDGNIAMIEAEWWVSWNYWTDGRMQGEYGMVPFPVGPSHDQPVSVGHEVTYDVMLATVEQPEEKLIIWDAIQNVGTDEDWARWMTSNIETNAMDRETVETVITLNENAKVNLIRGFEDINSDLNDFFNQLSSGETTVQTGLESINSQIQILVEDFESDGVELGYDEEPEEETDEE